jgi:hypothetical protein
MRFVVGSLVWLVIGADGVLADKTMPSSCLAQAGYIVRQFTGNGAENLRYSGFNRYDASTPAGNIAITLTGCPGNIKALEYDWDRPSHPVEVTVPVGPIASLKLSAHQSGTTVAVVDRRGRTISKPLQNRPRAIYFQFDSMQASSIILAGPYGVKAPVRSHESTVLSIIDAAAGPTIRCEEVP